MILQVLVYKHLVLIVLLGALFYAVVPGLGAFWFRHKWRVFRSTLIKSVASPLLDYKGLRRVSAEGSLFRFFGALQALEGSDSIWLSDGVISVRVDLTGVPIYILPSAPDLKHPIGETGYPEEIPARTSWKEIFSLPEGTKMFLFGKVVNDNGKILFKGTADEQLFAVMYDCSNRAFFSQAIWTGRQRNEYWNPATPGSLTVGSFLLFVYFYILLQQPYMSFPAGAALLFSLVPILLFSPPGLFFYYVYRNLWKRARIFRAERDLLKLPLSYFPEGCSSTGYCKKKLPDGSIYVMEEKSPCSYPEGVVVRSTSLTNGPEDGSECYVFSLKTPEKEGKGDPMAENVAVSGNPLYLSRKSEVKAVRLEILSLLAVCADLLLNGVLLFFAINYLIR